jgi:hypothetical protein
MQAFQSQSGPEHGLSLRFRPHGTLCFGCRKTDSGQGVDQGSARFSGGDLRGAMRQINRDRCRRIKLEDCAFDGSFAMAARHIGNGQGEHMRSCYRDLKDGASMKGLQDKRSRHENTNAQWLGFAAGLY